jgi:hypothetical protein
MKKRVIRLTESDLIKLVKRVIKEQSTDNNLLWENFVKVMMTVKPKPTLRDFNYPEQKNAQALNWFTSTNYLYSVSINNVKPEISINAQVKKKEITEWWENRGYTFNSLRGYTFNSLISIPISFDNAQKVKDDLTEFFSVYSATEYQK